MTFKWQAWFLLDHGTFTLVFVHLHMHLPALPHEVWTVLFLSPLGSHTTHVIECAYNAQVWLVRSVSSTKGSARYFKVNMSCARFRIPKFCGSMRAQIRKKITRYWWIPAPEMFEQLSRTNAIRTSKGGEEKWQLAKSGVVRLLVNLRACECVGRCCMDIAVCFYSSDTPARMWALYLPGMSFLLKPIYRLPILMTLLLRQYHITLSFY